MNFQFNNINVGLVREVIREGLQEPFRIYLASKTIANGNGAYFQADDREFRSRLGSLCNIQTDRTVKKKIRQCIELGWFNVNEGTVYIRSFGDLINFHDVETALVHNANIEFIVSDKERFRITLFSIFLGSKIGQRKYGLVRNVAHISKAERTPQFLPMSGEKFAPESLSTSFLAGLLDKSKSTIHRWKMKAMRLRLMTRVKNQYLFENTSDVGAIQQAFPEEAYRIHLCSEKQCVKIQLTDQLSSPLRFRTQSQ